MRQQVHIINKYFFPVQAGIETCIAETYKRFSSHKWDITIHTSRNTLHNANMLPREEAIEGLIVRRYTTLFGSFFPDISWKEEGIIVLYNFSLFSAMPIFVQATVYKLFGVKKAKLVFAPHGGFTPDWNVFPYAQKHIKRIMHRVLGKRMINYVVDWIHSVAIWEQERLMSEGIRADLISVIPNGVEEAGFARKVSVSLKTKVLCNRLGKYLITIGRIHPIKNMHIAIESLVYLPEDTSLVILGQVEDLVYERYLRELVQQKQLAKRVVFCGAIRGADKFYLIRHAFAMVHPSQYEVDPLVVKEAITQGTVCIGAANTGTQYLIRDGKNGMLAKTKDSKGFAKKVLYIRKNQRAMKLQQIRKTMRKERKEYHWDKIAATIEKHFTALLTR